MTRMNEGVDRGGRARRVRVAAALASMLAITAGPFACRRSDDGLRGQSGSEAPAGLGGTAPSSDQDMSPPCPCGSRDTFLRVTLLETRAQRRTVRVEEVVSRGADLDVDVVVGAELEVEDLGTLPCFVGSVAVADGQQALAAFVPAEPSGCDAADCVGVAGSVRLTPWVDELSFAQVGDARISVPVSELDSLWSDALAVCIERHGDVWQALDAAGGEP